MTIGGCVDAQVVEAADALLDRGGAAQSCCRSRSTTTKRGRSDSPAAERSKCCSRAWISARPTIPPSPRTGRRWSCSRRRIRGDRHAARLWIAAAYAAASASSTTRRSGEATFRRSHRAAADAGDRRRRTDRDVAHAHGARAGHANGRRRRARALRDARAISRRRRDSVGMPSEIVAEHRRESTNVAVVLARARLQVRAAGAAHVLRAAGRLHRDAREQEARRGDARSAARRRVHRRRAGARAHADRPRPRRQGPAEVALSILAEIVAVRSGKRA